MPSRKRWDDFYVHLTTLVEDLSKEKSVYTGWVAFLLVTKYNKEGEDGINLLDPAGTMGGGGDTRVDLRKKRKVGDDEE